VRLRTIAALVSTAIAPQSERCSPPWRRPLPLNKYEMMGEGRIGWDCDGPDTTLLLCFVALVPLLLGIAGATLGWRYSHQPGSPCL
jgi:hypothetical protein